jgi:hypothetical protein
MGAAKGPVDRKAFIQEEEPVEQYEPAAGDYRLIDERLSQLAKQRDGQALERKEKIRGFNDQRCEPVTPCAGPKIANALDF